jgi:ABC-type transport system involved in multi-copper enzyme maturation permease subunit
MFSRTFALFLRSLRVDARLLRSHLMRFGLLLFVVVNLSVSQLLSFAMGAPGLHFFRFISWVNFGFASLAGILLFSTAITEEKEEQTLGLLRMANVGPFALLMGKLAPRLLAALLILAVQFPFTLLAITLGGVSWHQVHAAFWTLFAHIVLMGMLGLFSSVICRRSGIAVALTALLALSAVVLPLFAFFYFTTTCVGSGEPDWIQIAHDWGRTVSGHVARNTAGWRLEEILSTGFDEPALGRQVGSNIGAAGLLLAVAWLVFDLFNRNVDVAAPQAVRVLSLVTGRRRGRSRRAWRFPIVWKDFQYATGGVTAFAAKLLLYGPIAFLMLLAFNDWYLHRVDSEEFGTLLMTVMLYLALPLEGLLLAARIFRGELKEKTWTALVSLPLSLPEIAYPKVVGCLLGLGPAVLYFLFGMYQDPDSVGRFINDMTADWVGPVVLLNFIVHALLLLHLSSLLSIMTNTWVGLLLTVLVWVMGFWALSACITLPLMLMSIGGGGPPAIDPELYMQLAWSASAVFIMAVVVALHVAIGSRLKAAAAAS